MHLLHRANRSFASPSFLGCFAALVSLSTLAVTTGCSKSGTSEGATQPSPSAQTPQPIATNGAPNDAAAATGAADAASQIATEKESTMTDATSRTTTASESELQADGQAANAFTLKAFGKAKKGSPGNVLLSGTSLRRALGVAYLGARGETAHEMSAVLGLPGDVKKAAELEKGENAAWYTAKGDEAKGVNLVVADRLWADATFPLASDYTQLVSGIGAGVASLDFLHAAEEARGTINRWVSEKTKEKIPELLPQGTVRADTRVVITNAIYFKGSWSLPFSKNATKDEPFTAAGGRKITAPMMHATDTYAFLDTKTAKVLDLRYQGSDLSMTIVLPKDANGLSKLEDSLDPAAFDAWTKATTSRVNVTLPKFTFGWGGSMNKSLQEMGIKTAFGTKADFTGIAAPHGSERVEISEVVHKTWIAVDESGTEAAAATGLVMRTTGMPMGPIAEFKADHPFLFFIRDTKSGRILFVGHVVDPTK